MNLLFLLLDHSLPPPPTPPPTILPLPPATPVLPWCSFKVLLRLTPTVLVLSKLVLIHSQPPIKLWGFPTLTQNKPRGLDVGVRIVSSHYGLQVRATLVKNSPPPPQFWWSTTLEKSTRVLWTLTEAWTYCCVRPVPCWSKASEKEERERGGRGGREREGGGRRGVSGISIQSLGLRVSVSRQLRIGEGYKDRIETGGRSTCEG